MRAALVTARRAGLRRSAYRGLRLLNLRLIDPLLASRLYIAPRRLPLQAIRLSQQRVIEAIGELRSSSPTALAWDSVSQSLTLLNQSIWPMRLPVAWRSTQMPPDPLWVFRLHEWDWTWPALACAERRDECLRLVHDWIAHVPIGRGLAWEPYSTSRRLVMWCALSVLAGATPELLSSLIQHAHYLAHHLERDLDNNHLIANAKALAWYGLLFPQLPRATQYKLRGLDLLWSSLLQQTRPDGGHIENSASYHLGVWLDGYETALLCRVNRQVVPAEAWRCLGRMWRFAQVLRRPDGELPLLNDSIEGEPAPFCSIAGFVTRSGDDLQADGLLADRARISHSFADSGYTVLRSGPSPEDTYLLFDSGDLGPGYCPGHGHADALSFELWANGEPLIVDPGVYQYAAGPWRDYFRGTLAHSTVQIDNQDQSVFAGPFRVAHLAHGRLLSADLDGQCPTVKGQHDGYTRLSDPVLHQRSITLEGRRRVVIVDTLHGRAMHQARWSYHLAPSSAQIVDRDAALINYPNGTRLLVRVDAPDKVPLTIEDGWVSHSWYERQPSPVLSLVVRDRSPLTLTTYLEIQ